jgi:hypothetical protein
MLVFVLSSVNTAWTITSYPKLALVFFVSRFPSGKFSVIDSRVEETRVRWVQAHTRAEAAFLKVREIVNEGVGKAEDALHHIVSLVTDKDKLFHSYDEASGAAKQTAESTKSKLKGEL